MIGAQEKTRTSTPFRTLAPEASASTNSATWASFQYLPVRSNRTQQAERRLFELGFGVNTPYDVNLCAANYSLPALDRIPYIEGLL